MPLANPVIIRGILSYITFNIVDLVGESSFWIHWSPLPAALWSKLKRRGWACDTIKGKMHSHPLWFELCLILVTHSLLHISYTLHAHIVFTVFKTPFERECVLSVQLQVCDNHYFWSSITQSWFFQFLVVLLVRFSWFYFFISIFPFTFFIYFINGNYSQTCKWQVF